ncbi:MAG: hypothetical protein NVS3B28_10130 [Candidatus Velthaea sp.]
MAAKRKIAPPKPDPSRSWDELTKSEQSAQYNAALTAYAHAGGPNPKTRGQFFRERSAAAAKN